MRHQIFAPLLLAGSLAACMSQSGMAENTVDAGNACLGETRADTFVVGLDKPGAGGKLDFVLESGNPAPPARGDNLWVIQINAMTAGVVGSPETGATITATPFMPDHGHGTPIEVNITPMPTAGQYQLDPVNLWMPGYWETTVQATVNGVKDDAVFKFCIPN